MRKTISAVAILMVAVILSNCNGGGSTAKTGSDSSSISKKDSTDQDLDDYLHIRDHKEKSGFMKIETITPEPGNVFSADSTAFDTSFISTHQVFTSSSKSFPISVYELYHNLQSQLGLKNIQQANDVYGGIRIYPALDTTSGKQLYIVLMGETATAGPLAFSTMLSSGQSAYTIKNNIFSVVPNPSAQYRQLYNDIKAFQKVWKDREYPFGSMDDINRSMCFSISEYYEVLNLMDPALNMIKDTTNSTGNYKIVLYPCYKDKKLRFVIKGMNQNVVIPASDFYNNMDVCPTKCPKVEIR